MFLLAGLLLKRLALSKQITQRLSPFSDQTCYHQWSSPPGQEGKKEALAWYHNRWTKDCPNKAGLGRKRWSVPRPEAASIRRHFHMDEYCSIQSRFSIRKRSTSLSNYPRCSFGKRAGTLEKEAGGEKSQNWRRRTGGGLPSSLKREERQIGLWNVCVCASLFFCLFVCVRIQSCICMQCADNISAWIFAYTQFNMSTSMSVCSKRVCVLKGVSL